MSWWLWLYIGVVVVFTTIIVLALQRSSQGRLAGRKGAHARVTGSATDAPAPPRFGSASSGSRTANSGTNVKVLTAPAASEPVVDEPMPPEGTPPSKWTYAADSTSRPTAHLASVQGSTSPDSAGPVGTTSESASAAEAEPVGTTLTATRPDQEEWPPGPYGEGSVHPPEDGSIPEGYPIKGNAGSMLFHTKESPYYGRTKAEVHFATEEHAEAAGFKAWNWRRHQG